MFIRAADVFTVVSMGLEGNTWPYIWECLQPKEGRTTISARPCLPLHLYVFPLDFFGIWCFEHARSFLAKHPKYKPKDIKVQI